MPDTSIRGLSRDSFASFAALFGFPYLLCVGAFNVFITFALLMSGHEPTSNLAVGYLVVSSALALADMFCSIGLLAGRESAEDRLRRLTKIESIIAYVYVLISLGALLMSPTAGLEGVHLMLAAVYVVQAGRRSPLWISFPCLARQLSGEPLVDSQPER